MMKNAMRVAGLLLIAALFMAGCYGLIDEGVGSVGIELPDTSSGGGDSTQEIARIYLINENALVSLGESVPYHEVGIETVENEVSIGPVASGPGYQIVLALGNPQTVGDSDVFVPEKFAWTEEPFDVIAGEAVDVELVSAATPFDYVPALLGRDLVGIEFISPWLYTATGDEGSSTVFEISPAGLSINAQAALPADETAKSIGYGALVGVGPVPWINTTKGIIPFNGGVLEVGFDGDYLEGAAEGTPPLPAVLSSGAFLRNGDLYGWFQVDGGLGGVYDQAAVPDPKQWLRDIDLSAFISGEPIYDLAVRFSVDEIQGYFASKLGAFMIPEVVLTDPDINTVPEILEESFFYEVEIDGEGTEITELAVLGSELYLGTNRGVVYVQISEIEASRERTALEYSGLVTESLGRVVRDMAIGLNYHAILTANFLIVSANGGTTYSMVPIYAGINIEPAGLFLDDDTGAVLLAGEAGIATLDIDEL